MRQGKPCFSCRHLLLSRFPLPRPIPLLVPSPHRRRLAPHALRGARVTALHGAPVVSLRRRSRRRRRCAGLVVPVALLALLRFRRRRHLRLSFAQGGELLRLLRDLRVELPTRTEHRYIAVLSPFSTQPVLSLSLSPPTHTPKTT